MLKRKIAALLTVAVALGTGAGNIPSALAAAPPLLANYNFTNGTQGFSAVAGGVWAASGGEYVLSNPAVADTGNGNLSTEQTPVANAEWMIEVGVTPISAPGGASVIYDYSDPQNYGYVRYSTVANDLFAQGIFKVSGGNVTQLASFNSALTPNVKTAVKVKYDGAKIKAYRGSTYLNGVTYTHRAGAFTGLGTPSYAARFDDYKLYGSVAAQPIAPLPQVLPTPPSQPPAAPTSCDFTPVRTVPVDTAAGLVAALADAQPGDHIQLADGVYSGNFVASSAGSASQPIKLSGSPNAKLDAGNPDGSYVLHMSHADYWCVSGISVTNGNKGIVGDFTSNTVFENLDIYGVGDEAIHLRSCSSNNIIRNSHIHHTGLRRTSFGEGIYLGTAESNWGLYNYCTPGSPDPSHYNRVLNNTFDNVAAEAIDAKEGTQGGVISGNSFDTNGVAGDNSADSAVDIKGGYYTVSNNTVVNSGASAVLDGFQTHVVFNQMQSTLSGRGNVFSHNTFNLVSSGYGIRVDLANGGTALVTCDNVAVGPALGLSNLGCRP